MASDLTDLPENPPVGIFDAPFDSALSERYLVYALSTITARSLPEIGRRFGGRDHTTVLHAVRKIEKAIVEDRLLHDEVDLLKRMLQE